MTTEIALKNNKTIHLVDNPALSEKPDQFIQVKICVRKTLESWRDSIFSHEWLDREGHIKNPGDMPERERVKRAEVENAINAGKALERPVLGIGIMNNVEIGSGRAVFLTLAANGAASIDVYIPRSNLRDFKAFLADVE